MTGLDAEGSIRKPTWVPNATGSIATRSVSSVHIAVVASLPSGATGNEKGKWATERGKQKVTKTTAYRKLKLRKL